LVEDEVPVPATSANNSTESNGVTPTPTNSEDLMQLDI